MISPYQLDAWRGAAEAVPGAIYAQTFRGRFCCRQGQPAALSLSLSSDARRYPRAQGRLRKELIALSKDPLPNIEALPCDDNILEWHCAPARQLRAPAASDA